MVRQARVSYVDGKMVMTMLPPVAKVVAVKEIIQRKPFTPLPRRYRHREKIWDNYILIDRIQRTDIKRIDISVATRDGLRFIALREFVHNVKMNKWFPTRSGMCIPLVYPINDGEERITPMLDLLELLPKAVQAAKEMALEDPDNAIYYKEKTR